MNKFALAAVFGVALIGTSASAQNQDNQEANRQAANAQQQSQSNASEEEQEENESEKVICRSEPVLGSRTRVNRICMTKAQWDYQAERTREEVNRMGRTSNTFDN